MPEMSRKETIIELQEIAKERDLSIESREALERAISDLEMMEKSRGIYPLTLIS